MGFLFDIKGQLNTMRLADSKALWPLFEAVVNSIQSIEDSPNRDCGKIVIRAHRKSSISIQCGLEQKDPLERFESFSVTDNGMGLNKENYKSFNTAYSTLKVQKGCKGIGRFLWLKAFDSVEVESIFAEGESFFRREFVFTPDGISPEDNQLETSVQDLATTIRLNSFHTNYQNAAPVELEVVAKRIIEHCLPFFISGKCPEITLLDDESTPIKLNQYYEENVRDSLHQDHFSIKDTEFTIYHLRLPEGFSGHELHLCANMQEVRSVELKKYIPDLQKKIIPNDGSNGFFYVGYIVSDYLDARVNTTRTEFDFDENYDQISLFGTSEESILTAAIDYIRGYLGDYLSDIKKKKRQQIDNFVQQDRPTYRYLLQMRPEIYDNIPAGLKPDALELELHKEVQAWETEIKKQGIELEKAAKNQAAYSDTAYKQLFDTYWSGITEISKTSLAEYVTRRKTLLTILEDALTIQESGRFKREDVIHSLVCPMRHTSDDMPFEEMNLWVIDERLAYHKFLASDKTIKSLPEIDSTSTKELDIAVFDRAFAFSEDDAPLNTITIIEFKKPDNTKDNPLRQMGGYIDEIVSGRKKRASGLAFGDCSRTCFRCFAICDLTSKMISLCKDAGFRMTPDGMGYYGYQSERNAYFEVISYSKLLSDAKKRNQILFDKLFSAKAGEVNHVPDVKQVT
ncbi:MAG: hypothetical protein HDT20_05990 [Oscillibacter sp.]|nr:hypothetical protein [Oscillibacter sp.]